MYSFWISVNKLNLNLTEHRLSKKAHAAKLFLYEVKWFEQLVAFYRPPRILYIVSWVFENVAFVILNLAFKNLLYTLGTLGKNTDGYTDQSVRPRSTDIDKPTCDRHKPLQTVNML